MRIPQVRQTLEIINLMEEQQYLRFGELKNALGMSKPTLSAMLQVLTEAEFIEKTNRGYCLGHRFLHISSLLLNRMELRQIAYDHLRKLHNDTGARIELSIPDGLEILFVEIIESTDPIGLHMRVGGRTGRLNAMAPGKILLAHLPEEQRKAFYRSPECLGNTPYTVTKPAELEKMCRQIQKDKTATDIQEARLHAIRIAAGIFDHTGKLAGVISLPVLAENLTKKRQKELLNLVKNTADKISQKLGYKEKM